MDELFCRKSDMLKEWGEVVGTLNNVKDDGEDILLEFTSVCNVRIPKTTSEVTKKLQDMVGKRIGVLRTDVPGKEILIEDETRKKGVI